MIRNRVIFFYASPEESAITDLNAIENATHFILFYPYKTSTSALIELGYALALRKKILIAVPDLKELPYLAQGLGYCKYNTKYIVKSVDKITVTDLLAFLNE